MRHLIITVALLGTPAVAQEPVVSPDEDAATARPAAPAEGTVAEKKAAEKKAAEKKAAEKKAAEKKARKIAEEEAAANADDETTRREDAAAARRHQKRLVREAAEKKARKIAEEEAAVNADDETIRREDAAAARRHQKRLAREAAERAAGGSAVAPIATPPRSAPPPPKEVKGAAERTAKAPGGSAKGHRYEKKDPGPPRPAADSVAARSRIYLRLDPAAQPDPDGTVAPGAVGTFRVVSRGSVDAEASGWLGRAPGAASRDGEGLTGDVSTLLFRQRLGPLSYTVGRHFDLLGGQLYESVDGASARLKLGHRFQVGARAGLLATQRPGKELLGDALHLAVEARGRPLDALEITLGGVHQRPAGVDARTRWTLGADYRPSQRWWVDGAATADTETRSLIDGRLEGVLRPQDAWWLRGYGRRARIDQLLAADLLLAVFAEGARDELGGAVEHELTSTLRLWADGAWVRGAEHVGGRWRLGGAIHRDSGLRATAEITGRTDRSGNSASARLGARWPLMRRTYATSEVVGDLDLGGDAGGLARVGLGREFWSGWYAYAALEAAHTPRWRGRLGGLVLVEHALGAPTRQGSMP